MATRILIPDLADDTHCASENCWIMNYALVRDAPNAHVPGFEPHKTEDKMLTGQQYASVYPGYTVIKAFVYFDTSRILVALSILNAALRIYGCRQGYFTPRICPDFSLVVQSGYPTYPHRPAVIGDFDRLHYPVTVGNGLGGMACAPYARPLPYEAGEVDLDVSQIVKGGETKFCLRVSKEVDGIPPTIGFGVQSEVFYIRSYQYGPIVTATTNIATSILANAATLNGEFYVYKEVPKLIIDHDGGEGYGYFDVRFQYGLTVAYGTDTPWQEGKSGIEEPRAEACAQTIVGLTPDTTYHFRMQVRYGTIVNGADRTFTTPPGAPFTINKAYALAREEL